MLWIIGFAVLFYLIVYKKIKRYFECTNRPPERIWPVSAAFAGAFAGLMVALLVGNTLPYHYEVSNRNPVAIFESAAGPTVLFKWPTGHQAFLAQGQQGLFVWQASDHDFPPIERTDSDKAYLETYDAHFDQAWNVSIGLLFKPAQYRLILPRNASTATMTMRM